MSLEKSSWMSSSPLWEFEPALPPTSKRSHNYIRFLERLNAVRSAAGKVLTARRRENIGSTAEEAAIMLAVTTTKREIFETAQAAAKHVVDFDPVPIPVSARLMRWSVSHKYTDQLGSHFVHRVRQFIEALQDGRARMAEALINKARAVHAKNHPAVLRTMRSFEKAVDSLDEFIRESNLRPDSPSLTEEERKKFKGLIAVDARHDTSYCTLSGMLIQSWANGEGVGRYVCQDGTFLSHNRELHDLLRRVHDKCLSMPQYPGLADTCLKELRQFDPYLDCPWSVEKTIPSRVRAIQIGGAQTPAHAFHIATLAFAGRLFMGVPSRVSSTFTLGASNLVPHKGFHWLTYEATARLSKRFAECMRYFLPRSGVVALQCVPGMNRLEWNLAEFATALGGLCLAPIPARYRSDETMLAEWFMNWKARGVICHEDDVPVFRTVSKLVSTMHHIIVVTKKSTRELASMFPFRRGLSIHSMRSLCGCEEPSSSRTASPVARASGKPPGPSVLKSVATSTVTAGSPRSVESLTEQDFEAYQASIETPAEQPKAGATGRFTLQLTAGGSFYPPKAVNVSCEQFMRNLPIYNDEPYIGALFLPFNLAAERREVWGFLVNGGRFGVTKWIPKPEYEDIMEAPSVASVKEQQRLEAERAAALKARIKIQEDKPKEVDSVLEVARKRRRAAAERTKELQSQASAGAGGLGTDNDEDSGTSPDSKLAPCPAGAGDALFADTSGPPSASRESSPGTGPERGAATCEDGMEAETSRRPSASSPSETKSTQLDAEPTPDPEPIVDLAALSPGFSTWWEEFLHDIMSLEVTFLRGPHQLWMECFRIYQDRFDELDGRVKAGHAALDAIARREKEAGREQGERILMSAEDGLSREENRLYRESEAEAKANVEREVGVQLAAQSDAASSAAPATSRPSESSRDPSAPSGVPSTIEDPDATAADTGAIHDDSPGHHDLVESSAEGEAVGDLEGRFDQGSPASPLNNPAVQAGAGGNPPPVSRGFSSKAADLFASVEAARQKAIIDASKMEEVPDAPTGKWQRHELKPHHSAVAALRETLGPHVKSLWFTGLCPDPSVLRVLRKALWPKQLNTVYSCAEMGIIAVNGIVETGVEVQVEPLVRPKPKARRYKPRIGEGSDELLANTPGGRILVRSVVSMEMSRGYFGQPSTTELHYSKGWFVTMDRGTFDAEKNLLEIFGKLPLSVEDVVDQPEIESDDDSSAAMLSDEERSLGPGDVSESKVESL